MTFGGEPAIAIVGFKCSKRNGLQISHTQFYLFAEELKPIIGFYDCKFTFIGYKNVKIMQEF
jgi:hypothetical protein